MTSPLIHPFLLSLFLIKLIMKVLLGQLLLLAASQATLLLKYGDIKRVELFPYEMEEVLVRADSLKADAQYTIKISHNGFVSVNPYLVRMRLIFSSRGRKN